MRWSSTPTPCITQFRRCKWKNSRRLLGASTYGRSSQENPLRQADLQTLTVPGFSLLARSKACENRPSLGPFGHTSPRQGLACRRFDRSSHGSKSRKPLQRRSAPTPDGADHHSGVGDPSSRTKGDRKGKAAGPRHGITAAYSIVTDPTTGR